MAVPAGRRMCGAAHRGGVLPKLDYVGCEADRQQTAGLIWAARRRKVRGSQHPVSHSCRPPSDRFQLGQLGQLASTVGRCRGRRRGAEDPQAPLAERGDEFLLVAQFGVVRCGGGEAVNPAAGEGGDGRELDPAGCAEGPQVRAAPCGGGDESAAPRGSAASGFAAAAADRGRAGGERARTAGP